MAIVKRLGVPLLLATCLVTRHAAAASPSPSPVPALTSPDVPAVYADNTPRGALYHYLRFARAADYPAAAACLDLSGIAENERAEQGPILARRLKVVLDRTLWIELDKLTDRPEGTLDDGLPPDTERIGTIQSRSGVVEINLRRVRDGGGVFVWKFSPFLMDRIPDLYAEFGHGWLGDHIPEPLQRMRVLGLEAWQALGLLVLIPVSWLTGWLGSSMLIRIAGPLVRRTRTVVDDRLLVTMRRPLRVALTVAVLSLLVRALQLSVRASTWVDRLLVALAFVTAIITVGAIVEAFTQTIRERLEREGQKSGAGVVGVVNRIVKALLAAIALIGILQALGFNVTGLLAGLGIGGIALALAAQKTVENLIGGIMLMTDQPVKIGDYCRFGTTNGWVEDVGFRSTRIRTLERSLISVPNSELANVQIENLSDRDRIRFFATLNLRYETTPDQLRATLVALRALFIGHPKIAADPLRIRFVGFGASSLDVEIQSYVMSSDPNEFFAIREDLLLRVLDIVAASGTGFAYPSQTLYMAKDDGLDAEKTRAAEARIRALRGESKLPFPDFTPQEAGELSDRLDYPPEGSSAALPPVQSS